MPQARWFVLSAVSNLALSASLFGAEPAAAERGKNALLGRAFNPAAWTNTAYQNAWRHWATSGKEPPQPYAEAFREHYGLHAAPYANGGYPMGLRSSWGLIGRGITTDCLLCHGGSIAGQSYVGLGNTALDIHSLFEELSAADGRDAALRFRFGNVRGTTEAGAVTVFLLSWREADLTVRRKPRDLDLHDDLCEDTPAWWLLKKKKTMYYTGSGDARSVRALMQFMLTPITPRATFDREEATFADIQAYLLGLQPPGYPFAVDQALARSGEKVFEQNCSRCHGTYGPNWTYPNKIVPLEVIGTDRKRFDGISDRFLSFYNKSWFGHEHEGWLADEYKGRASIGYQAPPLDGIWATAPYLHNGSVPTVYALLNSKTRPQIFTRSYQTSKEAYDPEKLGWRVQVLSAGAGAASSAFERRKIYDTTQPGRSNGGHTFGDKLSEAERLAVIEYLKTL